MLAGPPQHSCGHIMSRRFAGAFVLCKRPSVQLGPGGAARTGWGKAGPLNPRRVLVRHGARLETWESQVISIPCDPSSPGPRRDSAQPPPRGTLTSGFELDDKPAT